MSITLYDAQGILDDLLRSSDDATKCAVCFKKLGDTSYYVCRYPDVVAPESATSEHKGHTACKACVDSFRYIGEAGSCLACLRVLGNRRSSIRLAGVALRPAIENEVLNKVLSTIRVAEEEVKAARERVDDARRQEGADRRAEAVEAKRVEAAKKADDKRMRELVWRTEQEVKTMRRKAADQADDIIERAEEEAAALVERAKVLVREKGTCRGVRKLDACALEKRRHNTAVRRHKVETYDSVVAERDRATTKLQLAVETSRMWVVRLGGDANLFTRHMEQCLDAAADASEDDDE